MLISPTLLGASLPFILGAGLARASLSTPPFTDFAGAPVLGRAFDAARQAPIGAGFTSPGAAYDDGLFTPVIESLSALREDRHTTLVHPAYPKHSVRVKKSTFCDASVKCALAQFALLHLRLY